MKAPKRGGYDGIRAFRPNCLSGREPLEPDVAIQDATPSATRDGKPNAPRADDDDIESSVSRCGSRHAWRSFHRRGWYHSAAWYAFPAFSTRKRRALLAQLTLPRITSPSPPWPVYI